MATPAMRRRGRRGFFREHRASRAAHRLLGRSSRYKQPALRHAPARREVAQRPVCSSTTVCVVARRPCSSTHDERRTKRGSPSAVPDAQRTERCIEEPAAQSLWMSAGFPPSRHAPPSTRNDGQRGREKGPDGAGPSIGLVPKNTRAAFRQAQRPHGVPRRWHGNSLVIPAQARIQVFAQPLTPEIGTACPRFDN